MGVILEELEEEARAALATAEDTQFDLITELERSEVWCAIGRGSVWNFCWGGLGVWRRLFNMPEV